MALANDIKMRILAEDKSAAAFRSAQGNLNKIETAAKQAKMAILGGAALVGAFGALTKRLAASADEIAKFSKRTGIAGEALQELQFAAEQSGVSAEAFNKAIINMVKNFADAKDGTGEALDEIKRLGIQLTDMNGELRPAEDLLVDLADAMGKVENDTEKLAIATKLFGARGSAMVQMLENGSGAMNQLRQQARDLGIVLSEDILKKSEDLTDQFNVLAKTIERNLTKAIVDNGPEIINITNKMLEVFKFMVDHKEEILAVLAAMYTPGGPLVKALVGLGTLALTKDDTSLTATEKLQNAQMMDRAQIQRDLEEQIKMLREEYAKLVSDPEILKDPEAIKALAEWFTQSRQAAIELFSKKMDQARSVAQVMKDKDGKDISEGVVPDPSFFDDFTNGAKAGFERYKTDLDNVMSATEAMTVRAFKGMEDALVTFVQTGKLNFRDLANSIVADLIRIQVRAAMSNVFSMFNLGNLFGTSADVATGTPVPVSGTRAAGGPVGAGRSYLVGENGPELLTMGSSNGYVSPSGAAAGGPITINYNIQSWDSRDTMSAIQQSAPQIVGIVQQAFNKRGRRGPMG